MGLGYSQWLTSVGTALQVQIDDTFRGRVTGMYIVAIVGGAPVGDLIGGWLGDAIGLRVVLTGFGVAMLLLAAFAGRWLHFRGLDAVEVARET